MYIFSDPPPSPAWGFGGNKELTVSEDRKRSIIGSREGEKGQREREESASTGESTSRRVVP